MAVMVAISPGILILLLCLQNILAQQCSNNVGPKNSAGTSQQPLQKAPCNLNQVQQNSGFFNSPPQPNMQQMNFQQQSNFQQAPFIQQSSNIQPQLNPQQVNSQQPVNSITNSQLLQQQQNQNQASNIFSALHSIKQSSQNQGPNNAKANPSQQNNYEQMPQTYTVSTPITNTPQIALQPSSSSSFVEYPQIQPSFTFQTAPNSNVPSQQNQQIFVVPAQKTYTNGQNNGYINPGANLNAASMQGPIVMIPGAQTNTPKSVPIVLTLQSPPTVSTQSQSALPLSQIIESQPIVYTVQTQPSPYSNQNQQVPNQPQGSYSAPMDTQSLISNIISQMQNPQGNNNALGSILPAMLSSKSEKSSSMKALLPLIFNMLNERRNGCGCPHCGYNNNNYHNHDVQEPLINTGYSSQKNYSLQDPIEDASTKITDNVSSTGKSTSRVDSVKNVPKNNETVAETSEEDEEAEDSEEDYEDE